MGKEAVSICINEQTSNVVETLEAFSSTQNTKQGSVFHRECYKPKANISKSFRQDFHLTFKKVKRDKKMEIMTRSRKRKQTRPRSVSGEISDSDIDDDIEIKTSERNNRSRCETDDKDGWESEIKKTKISNKPLFSKLCISKKRQIVKGKMNKDGPLTKSDIIEIINNSLQNSNVPCVTNRYRRHFLKQLHKIEQKAKEPNTDIIINEEPFRELTVERQTIPDPGENNVTEEIVTEGKKLTLEEMTGTNDGSLECKVCQKHFTTPGILSAHFITHSDLERDKAEARDDVVPDNDETCEKLDDSEIDNEDDFNDSEIDSDQSSCVDSEISGGKEKPSSDILESSTYFCHLCQERFTNITALQNHVQEHSVESDEISPDSKSDTFCGICQKNFASPTSLHVHNKIHTGENPYTCNTCNKSFRDKTRLTTHIRVHTGEKPFICSVCQKSFSQKGNLKLHQKIHTGERNCVCGICGNAFRSRSDLIRHMKIHSASLSSGSENEETGHKSPNKLMTKPSPTFHFESTESQARVLRSNKIKDLLEANDNITPIATLQGVKNVNELHTIGLCDINRMYTSQRDDAHNVRHKNDSYGSDRSQYKFLGFDNSSYLTNLNMEVEFIKAMTDAKMRSENIVSKAYACPLCGLSLRSFDAFNHHILLQHNPLATFGPPLTLSGSSTSHPSVLSIIDPFMSLPKNDKYTCKDCNEVFKSYDELHRHTKSHRQKELDVKGPILARDHGVGSFLSSTAMMEDLKFTSNEKLYSCDFCLKTFRRSHHLQTHMRTHTGDRPYTCVECNKCFARGDHLQNHRRTHTGEKPYQCDVCDKTYSQSHHLLRHKRTHTGERPYQCTLCDKTFSRDHHLKKHFETHHIIDMLPRQQDCKSPTSAVMPRIPVIPFNLVTHSSDRISQLMMGKQTENSAPKACSSNRIGQLMIDMQTENSPLKNNSSNMISQLMNDMQTGYSTSKTHPGNRISQLMIDMHSENSASKLMESMIKQHLREEGERKVTKTENSPVVSRNTSDKKETIKITDILNDEIDKGMTSHISTDLILDHMMCATNKPDTAFKTKSDQSARSMLDLSEHKRKVTHKNNSDRKSYSSQKHLTKDRDDALSKYLNVDRSAYGVDKNFMDQSTKVLEPKTLEDIVARSLYQEYKLESE